MKKIKYYLPVIIIGFGGLVILAMIGTGIVKEDGNEKVVIYFPEIADLPNTEQGTVVFEFNFPSAGFKVGNKSADMLMFLDSKTLPGLQMGYAIEEGKIKAGLPMMISEEITLIDGQPHKLAYAFNRDKGKQWIYLDGKTIGEGEFSGEYFSSMSGFAVKEYSNYKWVESPYSITVSTEDRFSGVII